MASQPSCRGCRHGQPPQNGAMGWCRLRQLPIHPELVAEVSCHHWTAREPRLPTLNAQAMSAPGRGVVPGAGRQLSLEGDLGQLR
ncbi:MAG: hypothetical protein ACKOCI_02255 [Cyanobium sp.]